MKPTSKANPKLSLNEQMKEIELELRSGHFKPRATLTVPERSEEHQASIHTKLTQLIGSISPQRADEINAEIRRMRDEEWD